jgi:hypothetical protein
MTGIERRLTKLEAASGPAETLVVFVQMVPAERDSPASATVGGRVWHREPDEMEEAFLARVAAEARQARSGNDVLVAFLDYMAAPGPESQAADASASPPPIDHEPQPASRGREGRDAVRKYVELIG